MSMKCPPSRMKYKAWNRAEKCWHYFHIPQDIGATVHGMGDRLDYEHWRQSTGLTDSQGVEAFEGDILQGSFGIPPIVVRSVIEWHEGVLAIHTDCKPRWATVKEAVDFLSAYVIGNIYEDGHLLEDAE